MSVLCQNGIFEHMNDNFFLVTAPYPSETSSPHCLEGKVLLPPLYKILRVETQVGHVDETVWRQTDRTSNLRGATQTDVGRLYPAERR